MSHGTQSQSRANKFKFATISICHSLKVGKRAVVDKILRPNLILHAQTNIVHIRGTTRK